MTDRTRVVKHITADFFTGAYRMTGRLSVGASGAIGMFNDTSRSSTSLEDTYISYVSDPASILAHYSQVRIAKTGLEALLVGKRDEIGPASIARAGYTRIATFQVLITTDAFEVRGSVEMPGKYDPDVLLVESAIRFFPVYNVTINACVRPDAKYSGEAVLINRTKVCAFCGGE
jgi:hypothetical protein